MYKSFFYITEVVRHCEGRSSLCLKLQPVVPNTDCFVPRNDGASFLAMTVLRSSQ
jgi:hypothetical protein